MAEDHLEAQSVNNALEEFCPKYSLYLKPICKVNITVQIPGLHSAGSHSKSLSTWEVVGKLRQLCPSLLSVPTQLKVSRATVEFVRFVVELSCKADVKNAVKAVDSQRIKLSGFPQALRVRGAEAPVECPRKHDWDAFFRDANDMDEMIPGERPDTVVVHNFPIRWFAPHEKLSGKKADYPSADIVKEVFQKFGSIRRIDIPILDPCQNPALLSELGLPRDSLNYLLDNFEPDATVSSSSGGGGWEGSFGKIAPPIVGSSGFGLSSTLADDGTTAATTSLVFTAFIQYSDYSGFAAAMEALRGMKLVYAPKPNLVSASLNAPASTPAYYSAEIQVDFDRSKHLSDEAVSRRRALRQRIDAEVVQERARQRRLAREAEEAAERRIREKEQMVLAQRRAETAEREAKELARQQRKRLRAEETFSAKRDVLMQQKLLLEGRRTLLANRRAAAIRILSAILHQVLLRKQESTRLQEQRAKRPKFSDFACQVSRSHRRSSNPFQGRSEVEPGDSNAASRKLIPSSSSQTTLSSATTEWELTAEHLRQNLLAKRESQLRQRLLERHHNAPLADASRDSNF